MLAEMTERKLANKSKIPLLSFSLPSCTVVIIVFVPNDCILTPLFPVSPLHYFSKGMIIITEEVQVISFFFSKQLK